MNGVLENKEHWLKLAQNVQNRSSSCMSSDDSDDSPTLVPRSCKNDNDNNLNNNNTIVNNNRSATLTNEDNIISNCTNSEIPKIVGKIGRLNSSQNIFAPKQNGITQEAMDQ